MTPLALTIHGTPRPQPRPRFVNGRVVSTADPKTKLWRLAVDRGVKQALSYRDEALPLFRGATRLRTIFTFVPPATKMERCGTPHTQKPDASNLLKLVEDVMEDCGVFKNDSQLSASPPEKWWGDRAGVAILVETMEGEVRSDPIRELRATPDWLNS